MDINQYVLADRDFYESPANGETTDSLFAAVYRMIPAGWTRDRQDVRVRLRPSEVAVPKQGWRIHVSACVDNAATVLDMVWAYCLKRRIPFAFLCGRTTLLAHNMKYASGKFVTIYPNDENELRRVLNELGTALEGQLGPYILSDLRWRDGPLYVRYGAETRDDRFLAEQLAERHGAAPYFPYQAEHPLQVSSAGGVHAATDRRTGRRVIVKEARPFAGLDAAGNDAVARLHRAHAMLRRLAGLPVAPQVISFQTCWEHTFLVTEHIEGTPLEHLLEPNTKDVAGHTRWALGVLDKVEHALAAVHGRGVLLGALEPRDILVRDDGGVVFTNLEPASEVGEQARARDVDRHALACLRLRLFLPLTPLLDRGADKAVDLAYTVADRFPVPKGYVGQVLDGLGLANMTRPRDLWPADWESMRAGLLKAIIGSATPTRPDRLFPGDARQFTLGGAGVAHGAAGVLHALSVAGCDRSDEHEQWLLNADPGQRAGFYDGLSGIAYVLDHLGHRDAAMRAVDRTLALTDTVTRAELFDGLAGVGLNLLHFASQSPALILTVLHLADRLATAITTNTPRRAGLMRGFSGPALFFVRLYEETGEERCLDLAATALRQDLACHATPPARAGIGLVLHEYLAHRADEEFLVAQGGIRRAAEVEFVARSGLFNGRAGLILYLARVSGGAPLARQIRRLAWHAVPHGDGIAFPDDHLVRLSMDLATGSAGVLLALNAALGNGEPGLPFLDSGARRATPLARCDSRAALRPKR
jgi:hypothetical protein